VEDMQLIKDMEHRSLSIGEGDGGRGRIELQNDERSVAMDDDKNY
jgi:hypothetical protein